MNHSVTGTPLKALRLLLCVALLAFCWSQARAQSRSHALNLKVTVISDSDGQSGYGLTLE